MAGLIMPCWGCGALTDKKVLTEEGLAEFYRWALGTICDRCKAELFRKARIDLMWTLANLMLTIKLKEMSDE